MLANTVASPSSGPHTKTPRKHSKQVHFAEQDVYISSPSPYQYTPLPDRAGTLHPALEAGLKHVTYNMTTLPSTVTDKGHLLSPAILMETVTVPPIQSMVIQCPLLPWVIKVEPPKSKQRNFIVVQDFFDCLYSTLHWPVTEDELNSVVPPEQQYFVTNTFRQRTKSLSEYGGLLEEQKNGLKRVDFLGEYVMFDGLSADLNGGGVQWLLQVSPPAPTHRP